MAAALPTLRRQAAGRLLVLAAARRHFAAAAVAAPIPASEVRSTYSHFDRPGVHDVRPARVRPQFEELVEVDHVRPHEVRDPFLLPVARARVYPKQVEPELDYGNLKDLPAYPPSLVTDHYLENFHDWRMRLEDAQPPKTRFQDLLALSFWIVAPLAILSWCYIMSKSRQMEFEHEKPLSTHYSLYHPWVNKKRNDPTWTKIGPY